MSTSRAASAPAGYPPPQAHDPIEQLFEDVFWVQGSIGMSPGLRVNRNMVVLRQDGALTVIGAVRLNTEAEAALDALGNVQHVIRLGYYHGLDDRYYVEHYGAAFWCQADSSNYPDPEPTHVISEQTTLPVAEAESFVFHLTKFPESAILLHRHGGLLITCDSLHHWTDWRYCNLPSRLVMPLLGFKLTTIVGPPWRKIMTPKGGSLRPDFERLLALEFDHHIGAHGRLCRGGAHDLVQAAVAAAFPG